jgi:hypothetical protein
MTLGTRDLDFHVGPMRAEETSAVAQLHFDFFGTGAMHGTTIASFGPKFLEEVFYRLNLDNPYLFVDVARYRGEVVAFSVYASNRRRVFRETLRRHFAAVLVRLLKAGVRRPFLVAGHVLNNLQFLTERLPEAVRDVPAWFFLLGVKPEYRNREFKQRTGIWVAGELWKHMESNLRAQGCEQFWTVVGAHNEPMNQLHRLFGMELVARGPAQGLPSNYYRRSLVAAPQ